jgi:hypothetical protein
MKIPAHFVPSPAYVNTICTGYSFSTPFQTPPSALFPLDSFIASLSPPSVPLASPVGPDPDPEVAAVSRSSYGTNNCFLTVMYRTARMMQNKARASIVTAMRYSARSSDCFRPLAPYCHQRVLLMMWRDLYLDVDADACHQEQMWDTVVTPLTLSGI